LDFRETGKIYYQPFAELWDFKLLLFVGIKLMNSKQNGLLNFLSGRRGVDLHAERANRRRVSIRRLQVFLRTLFSLTV
jgi:hypothetical protein